MNQKLLALMRARTDRNWELLATAAGEASSVRRTLGWLDCSIPPADRFSNRAVVRQRVEALAAFDILELARVASFWPRSDDFPGNLARGRAAVFTDTWGVALRYLPVSVQQEVLRGELPRALRQEKVALLNPAPRFEDWAEVVEFVQNAASYADLRATDRSTFPTHSPPEYWLDTLLDVPHGGRWSAFQSLRVLRSGVHRLGPGARMYLLELAKAAWASFSGDSAIQLLFFELAREIDPGAEVLHLAVEQVVESLRHTSDPERFLRTAYVVADTGWMMP